MDLLEEISVLSYKVIGFMNLSDFCYIGPPWFFYWCSLNLPLSFLVCFCVCACMCLRVIVFTFICTPQHTMIYIERSETNLECWCGLLDHMASELTCELLRKCLPSLPFPHKNAGMIGACAPVPIFMWILGIWCQILVFVSQCFCLMNPLPASVLYMFHKDLLQIFLNIFLCMFNIIINTLIFNVIFQLLFASTVSPPSPVGLYQYIQWVTA